MFARCKSRKGIRSDPPVDDVLVKPCFSEAEELKVL